VGLERGPLSFVSTTEELLGSCSNLENREYGRGDSSRWPRATLYPQNFALTSPTSGGLSASIVHLRTQATEFIFFSQYSEAHLPLCQKLNTPEVLVWTKLDMHCAWKYLLNISRFFLFIMAERGFKINIWFPYICHYCFPPLLLTHSQCQFMWHTR
jgi:hypothetical protein